MWCYLVIISALFCQIQKRRKKLLNFLGFLDISSIPEAKSQVTATAEMPTYVNTQHINIEALLALQEEAENTFSGTADDTKGSSPGKDLFDMSEFPSRSLPF